MMGVIDISSNVSRMRTFCSYLFCMFNAGKEINLKRKAQLQFKSNTRSHFIPSLRGVGLNDTEPEKIAYIILSIINIHNSSIKLLPAFKHAIVFKMHDTHLHHRELMPNTGFYTLIYIYVILKSWTSDILENFLAKNDLCRLRKGRNNLKYYSRSSHLTHHLSLFIEFNHVISNSNHRLVSSKIGFIGI